MKTALKFSSVLAAMFAVNVCCFADNEPIVRTYESPTGETYGSISIQLAPTTETLSSVDHVVLIDTSASQIGEHRKIGFEVLSSFLGNLPQGHRATVIAIDVAAVPMMDGFAGPREAAKAALPKLNSRFPAGATNIPKGLIAALEMLKTSDHGSITIIGDGMSAAHLLQFVETQKLTEQLRQRQIPVHSFAVGSKKDMQLLGVLAQETGGFVMRDETSKNSLNGEQAGELLASAASKPVVYSNSIAVSQKNVNLLPNRPLPVRSDRETVYLFSGQLEPNTILQLGEVKWTVPATDRTAGNTFLQSLWNRTVDSDGLALGLAGDWLVNLAHQDFENSVLNMEAQGVQALKNGALETAEQIGFSLQEVDPGNGTALHIINKAGEMLASQTVQVQIDDNKAVDDAVEAAAQLDEDRTGPRAEDSIARYKELQDARTQALRAEVDRGIGRALDMVGIDPDAASSVLTQLRGSIKSATDIDPETRNQLLRRLTGIQQDVISRKQKIALEITERNKRIVELEAQQRLITFQEERDAKLEQMVERIRALLIEGYQGDAGAFESAEAVGRGVLSEYPGSAMGVSVVFVSEAAGQLDKANRLRFLRSDRLLEVLYQVELSHVPFPDEPPIRYPPAEVWQALTILREKWESVDLRSDSPNEQKIYNSLDEITNVEFPGNTLTDVIEYIGSQHNIPIILDETALSNEGISGDDEVELVLSGITLRSALKLLLKPLALTYVIEDEVMKITTEIEAELSLQTRVYPVADLVIPIAPLNGGFGGGLGGQGGQQGGGQQGGGFGGGGQGGGGFGGGGQGQFSVPAQPVPSKKKPLLK